MILQYDFEGRKDLVQFVKTVAQAGLYVHLRIGPYVCAEWNFGSNSTTTCSSLLFFWPILFSIYLLLKNNKNDEDDI